MRKIIAGLAIVLLASLGLTGTASAQDRVQGTVTADPAQVPSAGEYTFTATGSGFIPDSSGILVLKCEAPGDALVPGVSTLEDIVATGGMIEPLTHCDIGSAQSVDADSDGNWTAELTAEVGDNFFLSAGDLASTQAGATWVPIVGDAPAEEEAEEAPAEEEAEEEAPAEEEAEAEDEELADTGVETGLMAIAGTAILAAGVMFAREGRRNR